jgi:WD40 repeat protein
VTATFKIPWVGRRKWGAETVIRRAEASPWQGKTMMRRWNILQKTCLAISLGTLLGSQCLSGSTVPGEAGAKEGLVLKERYSHKRVFKDISNPGFAMSHDGKYMVLTGDLGKAVVWEVPAGKEKVAFDRGGSGAVAFDPSGRRLVGSSPGGFAGKKGEGCLKSWELESGREELVFNTGYALGSIVFHPKKKQIVTLAEKSILEFRDAQTGQIRRSLCPHRLALTQFLFSPDGTKLATCSVDGTVRIIEDASGEELLTLKCQHSLRGIAFHPSGKFLASAGVNTVKVSGGVKIWNAENGELLRAHDLPASATRVAYSPDGKLLAVGGAGLGRLFILDAETGRQIVALEEQGWPCSGLAFNPEGTLLVAAFGGTVKVWEVSPPAGPKKKTAP